MDSKRFWREREESIGEPIVARALGELLPEAPRERSRWGLLYITPSTFYFHSFPRGRTIADLFSFGRSEEREEREEKEEIFEFPRDTIEEASRLGRRSLLDRLFPKPSVFKLVIRTPLGGERVMRFQLANDPDSIMERLGGASG